VLLISYGKILTNYEGLKKGREKILQKDYSEGERLSALTAAERFSSSLLSADSHENSFSTHTTTS